MNYLTDETGKPQNRFNPQPTTDVVSSVSLPITGETVTFKAGAAGTKGVVSLNKNRLTNGGHRTGSFWGEQQNVVTQSGAFDFRISSIVETAGSAAVTLLDKTSTNLKTIFEITSGNSQYVIELIDPSGNTLYGYIRGITKTGDSYAIVVNNTLAGGTQNWVGDTSAFISTTAAACAFRICQYESSISWTTGTILLQEKKYDPAVTDFSNLATLTTNGDYCVDYFSGRILYNKATTGTSDTIAYSIQSGNGGSYPSVTAPTSAEVSVDTTAGGVQLLAANASRRGIILVNGSVAINIGPSGLTYGTTPVLAANGVLALDDFKAALYGITSAGSSTVRVFTW